MTHIGDADIDKMLDDCLKTMVMKGRDYTLGSPDRLHNFKTVAEFTGQTMEQVFSVYFYKHVAALFNFVKSGGQSESEPIEGRIQDCIVYLLLFSKMVAERKRASPTATEYVVPFDREMLETSAMVFAQLNSGGSKK